jgi:hypothetical protein
MSDDADGRFRFCIFRSRSAFLIREFLSSANNGRSARRAAIINKRNARSARERLILDRNVYFLICPLSLPLSLPLPLPSLVRCSNRRINGDIARCGRWRTLIATNEMHKQDEETSAEETRRRRRHNEYTSENYDSRAIIL